MKKTALLISVFLLSIVFFSVPASGQTKNPLLEEGIQQYQSENYEEAIGILEKARTQEPESSMAAFFLGMAYKQTMDFKKAAANLEASLTLKPPVREALVEYINILFQLDRLSEAKKWIKIAREQNIAPADVAFLEGQILAKEKKYAAAIESFEKAKKLDPNLAQTADYQIALCYMNDRKFKNAQERFKATASYDPKSDLAAYSRQYLEAVESNLFYTRPLRVTLGLSGGFDSNIVSKPRVERLAGGTGDPGGGIISPSARIEYVPNLNGPWLFNAMYAAQATFNEHFSHSRDSVTHTFSVIPGYNFGRFSISLLGNYTYYSLKTDSDIVPDGNAGFKHYEDYFTAGPIIKFLLTETQILEVFGGYDKKNYYNQQITSPFSIRDAEGMRAYASWTWFFLNNGFVNLRYEVFRDVANGIYWDNTTNRFAGSLVLPVLPAAAIQKIGSIYLQLGGSYTPQDYTYEQPYQDVDGSAKSNRREDKIYNYSAGLYWDVTKNWTCMLQYTRIKSDSNIPIYEYTRNLYTAGVEFRF